MQLDPKGLEAATDAIVTAAYTGEPDEVSREYCADFANAAIRAYLEATGEAKPVGFANLYRDDDGNFQLGGVDVYPAPEPEWGEFADDFVGPVAIYHASAAPVPATPAQEEIKALNDLASTYPGDIDGSIRSAIAALSATPEQGSMDALEAMRLTVALSNPFAPVGDISSLSHPHLVEMLATMESGGFSYGKACRWLGWAQAAVVANGNADLDTMKAINKRCQRAAAPAQEVPYGDGYCTRQRDRTAYRLFHPRQEATPMTSPIVERLRNSSRAQEKLFNAGEDVSLVDAELMAEAAAEIERLAADNARERAERDRAALVAADEANRADAAEAERDRLAADNARKDEAALMPDNLDFVIERLAEACRDGWTYGYIGDDGKAHNSFGDALSHLRNYRASGLAALGGHDDQ